MKLKRLFLVCALVATMCASASALVKGDVTGDNKVDIADVNTIINIMLGKAETTALADVSGNGSVDIADVNAIINIMLGKDKPGKVEKGIREDSGVKTCEVLLSDLFGEFTSAEVHPTVTAMGQYLVVDLGNGTTPVYIDKMTGEKKGEIAIGEADASGCVTTDEAENLIIANFSDGQGGNFCLWKTSSVTEAPVKILEFANAYGITLGDYVQVIGDINGDAVVVATFGGLYAQHIARWTVTGGEFSAEPAVVSIGGTTLLQIANRDNNFNIAQRTADPADGYFVGQYASGADPFYFINGETNEVAGSLKPLGTGAEWGMKYANCYTCTFNGKNYTTLFAMGYWPHWGMPGALYLFDTDTVDYFNNENTVATASGTVATFAVGDADPSGATVAGDARVADVKLIPTKDGYYLDMVYTSNTHLTVGCVEFDCLAQ